MTHKTFLLGLIGFPLGHSLSPQIHAAALYELSLSGEYALYPLENKAQLQEILVRVREGAIHGLNVTIPYKQDVIPYLDELTPAARAIGAVNTIFHQDGKLWGENTDAPGFWADLVRQLAVQNGGNALILGAGGSARAVAYALLTHDYHITVAARRVKQAKKLRKQLSAGTDWVTAVSLADLESGSLPDEVLIVNATPVGMFPNIDASPWPENLDFPQNAVIYDLVYNPRKTRLAQQAQDAGLPSVTGIGMLVEQAALAFERWTGQEAPRPVMWEALEPLNEVKPSS